MKLGLLFALAASVTALPCEVRAESRELGSFVDAVARRAPGVAAAGAEEEAAGLALDEALARSFPRLRAASTFTRGDDPVYVFGSLLQQRSFDAKHFDVSFLNDPGYRTHVRSSIELGLPVYTGGALRTGRRLAFLSLRRSERERLAAAESARFRAIEAYLTALLKDRQAAAWDARAAEAAEELRDADRLKAKGLVLGSDYYAAEAALEGLRLRRVRAGTELDAAVLRMEVLAGDAAPEPPFKRRLGEAAYPAASDAELTEMALRFRGDVRSAALRAEAAGAARRLETAAALPQVEAFAALTDNTEDFSRHVSDRLLGVRASLSIGDPGRGARRARAKALHEAGQARRAEAEETARIDVLEAAAAYRGSVESLPSARKALESARRALELFRPLYREGRQSILDVLRAEEGLAAAEAGYWEVLHGVHLGYARLLFAAGLMDEAAAEKIESRLEAAP